MTMITPVSPRSARFGVVLVNYKTHQLTQACLDLLRQALKDYDAEVWVIDNNSDDASSEYLRSLEWINLIERKPPSTEKGSVAHGEALDLVLKRVNTEFLFLLHTDTLIHDSAIFEVMLTAADRGEKVYSVGCLEQKNRGPLRSSWRLMTRFVKYQAKRLKFGMGYRTTMPKYYRETHIKSFCALWNVRFLKAENLKFSMAFKNPGYEAQDRMQAAGYQRVVLKESEVFQYLDHLQARTKGNLGDSCRKNLDRRNEIQRIWRQEPFMTSKPTAV